MNIFSEKRKKKEFEKIYDENIDKIFRFVYLKTSSKSDAEDITSKAFASLWKKLNKEESVKNPRAFLYSVARNMIIDYYRKNKTKSDSLGSKNIPIEEVVIEDKDMRADERATLNSEMEEVKEALSKLNENYQNIIIWYYLDELTIPEIASLLEKPESTVRVLIHRAMSSLKLVLNSNRGKELKK